MIVLWIIIYLVAGFGFFWLLYQEDLAFQLKLAKVPENDDPEKARIRLHKLDKYMKRTRLAPKRYSKALLVWTIPLAILTWGLWPIMTIVVGIWYAMMYRTVQG